MVIVRPWASHLPSADDGQSLRMVNGAAYLPTQPISGQNMTRTSMIHDQDTPLYGSSRTEPDGPHSVPPWHRILQPPSATPGATVHSRLSLLLEGRLLEHLLDAAGLDVEELGVLGGLHGPGGVERSRVLLHQVSVFGPAASTEVLDLRWQTERIRTVNKWIIFMGKANLAAD